MRTLLKIKCVLLCMVVLWGWAGEGAVYFVSPTGNDSNTGLSWAQSLATVQHAHSVASPGDTITVTNGYINERVSVTKNFLTIQSANLLGPTNLGFVITGSSNTIIGFFLLNTNVFTNFSSGEQYASGISIYGPGNNIVSNEAFGCGCYGLFTAAGAPWNQVYGNVFDTNGAACIRGDTSCSNHYYWNKGFRTIQFSPYCLNNFAGLDADGFYPGSCDLWESNLIGQINYLDPKSPTAHCDGFQFLPASRITNCVLNANFGECTNQNGAFIFAEGSFNNQAINNVCRAHKGISMDSGNSGWLIANNTLMGITNDTIVNGIPINLSLCTNFAIINEVVFDPQSTAPPAILQNCSGILHSNNIFFAPSYTLAPDASWSSVGEMWNVNPLLINPYSFPYPPNFSIPPNSPAVGAGTQIAQVGKDYFSFQRINRNDIGASQSQSSTIIPLATVPNTNTLPWVVGVSGGIPTYTNGQNVVTDYGADPTGASDSSTAINNAVAGNPPYSYLIWPSGTYRINSSIVISGRTPFAWKGTGFTIDSHVGAGLNSIYVHGVGVNATNALTSGYVRGSTNLVLATTTGITPNCYALINESNNPALNLGTVNHEFNHGQIVKVLSVSGNNITIDRPIYLTFGASFSPQICALNSPMEGFGIEGMTLDCANSAANDGIWYYRTENCWLKKSYVTNINLVGVSVQYSKNFEARECWSGHNVVQNSSRYGFQLANNTTDSLIYDCISDVTSTGYIIQDGSSGNVVGYCFFGFGYTTFANCLAPGSLAHGNLPNYNLIEGCYGPQDDSDSTWGANLMNTRFRCWWDAKNFGTNFPTDCRNAFVLAKQNYTNNVIGCVLCRPEDRGTIPSGSHSAYSIDADSAPSLFMHGNFDYFSGATQWSNSISHTLPSSYYLASKPSEFGILAWPPIGPDVNTSNSITNSPSIPAWWRYVYGTNPPAALSIARVTTLRVGKTYVHQ